MNFDRYIRIAKALRPESHVDNRNFHVTFIIERTSIAALGYNKPKKTHPKNLYYNSYISRDGVNISGMKGMCSELVALLSLGEEKCDKYDFLNIRLNLDDKLRFSRPCLGCSHILRQVGFRKLFYSLSDGNFEMVDKL